MKWAFTAVALILLIPLASATVTLDVTENVGNYSAQQQLSGTVTLSFNQLLQQTAQLAARINNQLISNLGLQNFIGAPSAYSFQSQSFSYNISVAGTNIFGSFPPETFDYTIAASGTCGGPSCAPNCQCGISCQAINPPNPYPCSWSASTTGTGSVRATDYLKFIYDFSIAEPPNNNSDTVWTVTDNNANVQTTMRAACGDQYYSSFHLQPTGWVWRPLPTNEFTILGGSPIQAERYIEKFDNSSLDVNRLLFLPPSPPLPGGIYKSGQYQAYGTQATWNGNTGHIRLVNFQNSPNIYLIAYLPPIGPRLCAFTQVEATNSFPWSSAVTYSGAADYLNPYTRTFVPGELSNALPSPPCPAGTQNCNPVRGPYQLSQLPGSPSVSLSFSSATNTTTGTTTSTQLSQTYSASVSLSSFQNLRAPSTPGNYILNISLSSQGQILAGDTLSFATCTDNDNDGVCVSQGDCNDADPLIHPGATELCDGKDNDCDGQTDENFQAVGSKIGNPCGTGVCAGIYVCTPDGQGVVCNSPHYEGESPEICGDSQDNDCDGQVDEEVELVGGQQRPACVCRSGQTEVCGTDVGRCETGTRVCRNGNWGSCTGSVEPIAEICNGIDDNCDGIIDNVGGGGTPASTACRCFGGAAPATEETCNDIDDNCNSLVDEDIICCQPGETRQCGSFTGACTQGAQSCVSGSWGACQGGVQPSPEICWNHIDENCDGSSDEGCSLAVTCTNSLKDVNEEGVDCGGSCPNACFDPNTILFVAIGALLLVAIIVLVVFMNIRK